MSQHSLADDIIDMENLHSSSGSSVSSSSGASSYQHDSTEDTDPKKLKGFVEAHMLAQLMIDNIVAVLQKRLPKPVGERINREQMFLQNRFRDYLERVVTPKLITLRNEHVARQVQASGSSSQIGSIAAPFQNIEDVLPFHINVKQFVEQCTGIENCNEAPLTPTSESSAIKLLMTTTEWQLKRDGYPENAIYAIKFRLLELQRQFLTYLKNTDAPYRLYRMQEAPIV